MASAINNADCLERIFRYLDVDDCRACFYVCRYFRFVLQGMIELKQNKKQLTERYPQIALANTSRGVEEIRRIACQAFFCQFPKTPIVNYSWFDLYQFELQAPSVDACLYQSFDPSNYPDLLALAKSNLLKDPTCCLKKLLNHISKSVHMRFIPLFPHQWPVVHALAAIVSRLPKPLVTKMLGELTAVERIELIKVLYPLRFSIKTWHELGLDLSILDSKGGSLAQIVVKQMIWLKSRSMRGLQGVWPQAAYINSGLTVQNFLSYQIKQSMESVNTKSLRAWDNDKTALAKGLPNLETLLQASDEPVIRAAKCIELISTFYQVTRRSREHQKHFELTNSKLTDELQQTIDKNIEIAIYDLRLLAKNNQFDRNALELLNEHKGSFSIAEWLEIESLSNPLKASLEGPQHLRGFCNGSKKYRSFGFENHFRQMSQ